MLSVLAALCCIPLLLALLLAGGERVGVACVCVLAGSCSRVFGCQVTSRVLYAPHVIVFRETG